MPPPGLQMKANGEVQSALEWQGCGPSTGLPPPSPVLASRLGQRMAPHPAERQSVAPPQSAQAVCPGGHDAGMLASEAPASADAGHEKAGQVLDAQNPPPPHPEQ
jgi:hypothetical protein